MKKKSCILSVIVALGIGFLIGFNICSKKKSKLIQNESKRVAKFKGYYQMLNQWFVLKNEGISLEKYFQCYNYKRIAIYGMGEMGNRFYEELKNSEIEIVYAIDKTTGSAYSELEVLTLEDDLSEVDAIVVTAIFDFNEIEENLKSVVSCPIIPLDDIVYEL